MTSGKLSQQIMRSASSEAQRRGDIIVHPESLLVAVADQPALRSRGVTADALRRQIDQLLGPPQPVGGLGGTNDTTSRVLSEAFERSTRRDGSPATEADVLVALLDESTGPQLAVWVLKGLGVDVDAVRRELDV